MKHDEMLNRRGWLRSLGLTTGGVGVLSLADRSALAGQGPEDKSQGIFNVTAYGAKGDSKNDDSDAIQDAINAAQDFGNGGIVFFPTGSYLVSKTLLITGRVKILGQGQATIDGATHVVPTSLDFDVIKAVGVHYGVVLEGFTIRCYSDKGTGGHFLRFQGCQHVRVVGVSLSNCWNGALVDSSGDVVFYDLSVGPCDVPGAGRYGIKCTAASTGNPNATQAWNCGVGQSGKHVRTVDAFVLANGYNSLTTINCGALNCNRAFWSTKDGGAPPNFLVVQLGTSDHCNTAVQLDDGSFNQFSELLVTSSYLQNINVGSQIAGPVAFSNCIITTSGSPPDGTGYRISATRAPSVSITGGSVHNTGGNALEISGDANVAVTGLGISSIQGGKDDYGADGVNISGSANIILTGLSLAEVKNIAIRVRASFRGTLTFSGISQHNANRGLYDEGSSGLIAGSGSFHSNFTMDVDVSRNRNAQTCIQSHGSVPWPFYPTPAIPASASQVRNTTGTNCQVYLLGGNVHQVTLDGLNLGIQTSIYLPINRQIAVHYTGTLAWVWQRVT